MATPFRSLGAPRAFFCAALVATALSAQGPTLQWQWCQRVPVSQPTPRAFAAFAAGPLTGNGEQIAVLFGGQDSNGVLQGDTWEWDGHAWWQSTNASAIQPLTHTAAALDPGALVGVLFGGLDTAGSPTDQTWLYEFPPSRQFRMWQQQFPATQPSARSDHAMSPSGAGILLFGGRAAGGTALNDTWTYDHRGRTWVQLTPAQSPPARSGHRMGYDSTRNRVVLFGGRSANGTLLNDTWEWDGASWSQVTTVVMPAARADHAMCGVAAGSQTRVMMHGGTGAGGALADAWVFDGVDWFPILPQDLAARAGHGFVESGLGAQPTTFGGTTATPGVFSGETWTLEGHVPPTTPTAPLVCFVAPGCSPAAVPGLTTDTAPRQDPFQPTQMDYVLSDLPTAPLQNSGLGVLVFGLFGGAVPCNPAFPPLQTDLQAILPFTYTGTDATVGYAIPTTPTLDGATLYHQALAILPTASLAWVTSDLIRVRIGQ